ncbi:hypothetical protein MPL3365_180226 [Mesorhizobium plurifarium]|uniref:Uncharacterized protein n=1 Tax=Mesorhizobium plurifarium TaxID=69974 RepID=A0A090GTM4_MESPL|nr:hypothetical protein MPL3365_180226 [Mesorhizobium plurifarium]
MRHRQICRLRSSRFAYGNPTIHQPERFRDTSKSDQPGNQEHPDHDKHKSADKHRQQGAFILGTMIAVLIEAAHVKNTPVLVLNAGSQTVRPKIASRCLPAQAMQQSVEFSPLGGVRGAQRCTSLSSLPAGGIGLSGPR